jgi:hypothetical protein
MPRGGDAAAIFRSAPPQTKTPSLQLHNGALRIGSANTNELTTVRDRRSICWTASGIAPRRTPGCVLRRSIAAGIWILTGHGVLVGLDRPNVRGVSSDRRRSPRRARRAGDDRRRAAESVAKDRRVEPARRGPAGLSGRRGRSTLSAHDSQLVQDCGDEEIGRLASVARLDAVCSVSHKMSLVHTAPP